VEDVEEPEFGVLLDLAEITPESEAVQKRNMWQSMWKNST